MARLQFPGSSIYANSGSEFAVDSHGLQLNHGWLDVSGKMSVLAACESISAATPNGSFSVTRNADTLLVRSNRGAVAIHGAVNYTVPAGRAVRMQTTPAGSGAGGCVSKGKVVLISATTGAIVGVVTGIIVHKASECKANSNTVCIVSPNK